MSNNDTHIVQLFEKYLNGTATPQEVDVLLDCFGSEEHADLLKAIISERFDRSVSGDLDNARLERLLSRADQEVLRQTCPPKQRRLLRWMPYAAAVLLTLAAGVWFFSDNGLQRLAPEQIAGDIGPGGNKATLTLADGTTIDLSEQQEGIVIGDKGITYIDGTTQVVPLKTAIEHISVSTPAKGTYQIVLPDGSKVWLHAVSRLSYPSQFSTKERLVELSGEAFFDISHLSAPGKVPFRVVSAGQIVEVLGTAFNVSAYADDPGIKTTLVEGRVRVQSDKTHQSHLLSPGQQATLIGDRFVVQTVETAQFTSWKDGRFYFDKAPCEEIMRQISRWYGVEVIYRREIPGETISGKVKRDISLSGLLDILRLSRIDVSRQGNVLIVN